MKPIAPAGPAPATREAGNAERDRVAAGVAATTRRSGDGRRWTLALWGIFLLAAGYQASYALQTRGYYVMTDELQYLKLALHATQSPLPQLHGEYFAAFDPLYPLLLAPLTLIGSVPDFFVAAHVLNPLLMTSVVFPTYLLGRAVSGSKPAALLAAAIAVAGPWLVFTNVLMTENAAYPAFAWAIYAIHRALERPSARNDLIALAGIALAISARTQFVVLAPILLLALPLAALLDPRSRERRLGIAGSLKESVRLHPVIYRVAAGGLAVALLVSVAASPGSIVGIYGPVFERSLLPGGIVPQILKHSAILTIGFGTLPVLMAFAYVAAGVRRGAAVRHSAFAALLIVTCPLLVYEASAFNLNFSDGGLNDRYVFYLIPLLAVAMTAALTTASVGRRAIAAGTIAVVALIPFGEFAPYSGDSWVGAPASAVFRVLNGRLTEFNHHVGTGITIKPLLVTGAIFFGIVIATIVRRRPGAALFAIGGLVLFWNVTSTGYQFNSQGSWSPPSAALVKQSLSTKWLGTASTAQNAPERAHLDWLDDAPGTGGASIALLPSGTLNQLVWWQDEFWNRDVDRMYRYVNPDDPPYGPPDLFHSQLRTLHHDSFAIDRATGAITTGTGDRTPARLVVMAERDPRFAIANARLVTSRTHPELGFPQRSVLWSVPVEPRAAWVTGGLLDDGWIVNGRVTLRVFGRSSRPAESVATFTLAGNPAMKGTWGWSARAGDRTTHGTLSHPEVAAGIHPVVRLRFCAQPGTTDAVELTSPHRAKLPDERVVGMQVTAVSVKPTGRRC